MATYARRDSATGLLRKMGLTKEVYHNYITPTDAGFVVDVKGAEKYLESLKKPTKAKSVKPPKGPVKVKYAEITSPRPKPKVGIERNTTVKTNSCAYKVRSLIAEGKTNPEIWAIIQPEFKLDDNKRHYPSWYRSEMARNAK